MQCIKCKKEIDDNSTFCNWCGGKQVTSKKGKPKTRGNGTGTVYKRGKAWTVVATINKKRKTKGGFKTKKEALDYIPILKNEKKTEATTLSSLWETYENTKLNQLSKNRRGAYKRAKNRLDNIADYDINTLTIDDLQNTVNLQAPTHYPARDMKTVLTALYDIAIAEKKTTINIAEYITLPKLEEESPEPFNEDEILAFWKGWNNEIKMCGYILLMIYSGMMPGELLKVSKNMIDLKSQIIEGAGMKTNKRKATPIVLKDEIIPVVKSLMEHSSSLMLYDSYKDKFYEEYRLAVTLCGCRTLPPYSCRHTTATALALTNTSPSIIKEIMRHTQITTTQRYIHVNTDDMLKAVNNLK